VLRPFYFSPDVAPEILAEATMHLCAESPRVLLDLSLRLHWQLPERAGIPVAAEWDRELSAAVRPSAADRRRMAGTGR